MIEIQNKIPVYILTGFLGSGKTTLLKKLVASPQLADTAVLINEFGEVGLDHLLVSAIDEEVILLESGCVCCSVKDDFSETLLDLISKRHDRQIPEFHRVVLETTGIADPLSIYQILVNDSDIRQFYRYEKTLTVVDAVYGLTNLENYAEAMRQVVLADEIIVSKADLAKHNLGEIELKLKQLNNRAVISRLGKDDRPEDKLLNFNPSQEKIAHSNREQVIENLREDINSAADHTNRYTSYCLRWNEPVVWQDFVDWLDALLFVRGDSILRLKGILAVKDKKSPVVIQGVQHSFYPPEKLAGNGLHSDSTELTFITCDFPEQAAINSLMGVLNVSLKSN